MVSSKTLEEIDRLKEKENMNIIEAILFISGKFISLQEMVSLSNLNPLLIKDLLSKLREKYGKEDFAFEIVEKSGLWKMDVKQDFFYLINKLATGSAEFSKAEQKTLATIAYKQPIKQSVIIRIRGNKAYDHIKKFLELKFLKKKREGHTYILSLSEDFYDYFNLEDGKLILLESEEETTK